VPAKVALLPLQGSSSAIVYTTAGVQTDTAY